MINANEKLKSENNLLKIKNTILLDMSAEFLTQNKNNK